MVEQIFINNSKESHQYWRIPGGRPGLATVTVTSNSQLIEAITLVLLNFMNLIEKTPNCKKSSSLLTSVSGRGVWQAVEPICSSLSDDIYLVVKGEASSTYTVDIGYGSGTIAL